MTKATKTRPGNWTKAKAALTMIMQEVNVLENQVRSNVQVNVEELRKQMNKVHQLSRKAIAEFRP